VQILRDLIDSTSTATRCVLVDEQALLERVSQVQIRQEVLYSSTRQDRVSLPQTLQLSVEDGNHIVQEACRRVRSKVCYVVSKRAAGGACLLHALGAECVQNADPSSVDDEQLDRSQKVHFLQQAINNESRRLEFTARWNCQLFAMCRWQAASIGRYHNKRCVSVAMRVWIGWCDPSLVWTSWTQGWALSKTFKTLRRKRCLHLSERIFGMWVQFANVCIFRCKGRYFKAVRVIRAWRDEAIYVRMSRLSRNMLHSAMPMQFLQGVYVLLFFSACCSCFF